MSAECARFDWMPAVLARYFAPYHAAATGPITRTSLARMRNVSHAPELRAEVTVAYNRSSGEAHANVLFERGSSESKLSGMLEVLLGAMRTHAHVLRPMLRDQPLHLFFQLCAYGAERTQIPCTLKHRTVRAGSTPAV